jgi:hypothetical protein
LNGELRSRNSNHVNASRTVAEKGHNSYRGRAMAVAEIVVRPGRLFRCSLNGGRSIDQPEVEVLAAFAYILGGPF